MWICTRFLSVFCGRRTCGVLGRVTPLLPLLLRPDSSSSSSSPLDLIFWWISSLLSGSSVVGFCGLVNTRNQLQTAGFLRIGGRASVRLPRPSPERVPGGMRGMERVLGGCLVGAAGVWGVRWRTRWGLMLVLLYGLLGTVQAAEGECKHGVNFLSVPQCRLQRTHVLHAQNPVSQRLSLWNVSRNMKTYRIPSEQEKTRAY